MSKPTNPAEWDRYLGEATTHPELSLRIDEALAAGVGVLELLGAQAKRSYMALDGVADPIAFARKRRAGLIVLRMLREHTGKPVTMDDLWAAMPDGNHSATAGLHWVEQHGIRLRRPGFCTPAVMLP